VNTFSVSVRRIIRAISSHFSSEIGISQSSRLDVVDSVDLFPILHGDGPGKVGSKGAFEVRRRTEVTQGRLYRRLVEGTGRFSGRHRFDDLP